MRKTRWLILVAILIIGLFIPVITVTVVPETSFRLIGEDGRPFPNARVEQSWKEYSLEFWTVEQDVDYSVSDVNGIVNFPARQIQVSVFQIIAAKIRDVVVSIDPHSGYGPHSFFLCRDKLICSARYKPGEELPEVITVRR